MRNNLSRRALAAAVAGALLIGSLLAAPAGAITDGSLDGDDHPQVGLMTAHSATGHYLWRCSGTLISPTVFITAGHCTEPDASQGFGPPTYALIFFSDVLIVPDPDFTLSGPTPRSCTGIEGYPCGDANEFAVRGSLHLHPNYDPAAFFTHDLGVVILDEPYDPPGPFATLPALDQFDSLQTRRTTTFTSVGYGLQERYPDAASWKNVQERIRMVAHPHLIQNNTAFVGDFSLLLSNNANTGGTCSGDSGGPNFIGTSLVIAGVTSYGLNIPCAGAGGIYRLDKADDLNWLEAAFGSQY